MELIRQCRWCGTDFTPLKGNVKQGYGWYCSRSCAAKARSKRRTDDGRQSRYKFVRVEGHPIASKTGLISEHRLKLYEAIGPGKHSCHWCGTEVEWRAGARTGKGVLVVDHIDNDSRNNDLLNLVPSCHACNVWRKHPNRLKEGDLWVRNGKGMTARARAVERTCEHCGEKFLHLAADKRPNRGRFCSRSCARRGPRK